MNPGSNLSDGGLLWPERGQPQSGWLTEVAPIRPLNRTFTFAIPAGLVGRISVGQRVRVPLGRSGRSTPGFVVSVDQGPWRSTLRPVESVIDDESYLSPDLVELGREISLHYLCPLGITLKAMTPESVRRESGLQTVRYARLTDAGRAGPSSGQRLTPLRRAVLEQLSTRLKPMRLESLMEQTGASAAVVRGMVAQGWLEIEVHKELPSSSGADTALRGDSATPSSADAISSPAPEPFSLTLEQTAAVTAIDQALARRAFSATLLFGVSGSGKTEVYIRAMQRVIDAGMQAILLVPEIALTTQLVQRVETRLPGVAVSHSGLSDAQRSVLWRRIAAGQMRVVVGTRSAVFSPCPRLGLICVDEEQEPSFKNLQAPRFNVRDAAIMRARQMQIPVVLGSATPSLETWYNAHHRLEYSCVSLPRRVRDLPMPKVHLVDMGVEFAERREQVILSRTLSRLLEQVLQRGEQAVILMNRRGFATRLLCPACGSCVQCPHCHAGLVLHSVRNEMRCHHCGRREPVPTVCPNPSCRSEIVQIGRGTQRIEDLLTRLFPDARIRRADSDTMTHRREYERLVDDFDQHRFDVLVGTQMVAKGLDFPLVSLVGIIDADPRSLAGDFRAPERLFQLITQVAGRAGRAIAGGEVVVQTTMPDLPALRSALQHDYEAFAEAELAARKAGRLPPFRRVARLVLAHSQEKLVSRQSVDLAERVRQTIAGLELEHADVLGPNPCVIARIRGRYRYDLLIRTRSAGDLRRLLHELDQRKLLRTGGPSLVVDVDPVSLS